MKGGADVARSLREILATPSAILIGTIDSIEALNGGYLATGTVQPDGIPFQARLMWAATGAAQGDFYPVAVGDEVLVLLPGGDPLRAVAIPGLTSSEATLPADFTNDKPRLVHPDGKTFQTAENATVSPVVVESVLPDLAGLATLVTTIASALGSLGITIDPTAAATIIATEATPTGYRSKAVFSE